MIENSSGNLVCVRSWRHEQRNPLDSANLQLYILNSKLKTSMNSSVGTIGNNGTSSYQGNFKKQKVCDGVPEKLDFPNYPCHTQSVERCVKLVIKAAAAVYGATKRDGLIRVRLESRQLMPQFNTKAEYRR